MNTDTQFQFKKVKSARKLDPLKSKWRKSLVMPNDDFWDALNDSATHWLLTANGKNIGYACIDENHVLLQFFVLPLWVKDGQSIFKKFIKQQKIKKARVGTNNPVYLSIAMHFQKSTKINGYLFTDLLKVNVGRREEIFRVAHHEDLEKLVDFNHSALGASKEWLTDYIDHWIARGEYFILEEEGEILGICEVRTSSIEPAVACLGIVVSAKHRKKGLGTFLMGKAKEKALRWGKQPICACDKDNVGSLACIQNNGLRITHLLFALEF